MGSKFHELLHPTEIREPGRGIAFLTSRDGSPTIDGGIDPMHRDDDMALLEKFKGLIAISQRIKKSEAAAVLELPEIELIKKLIVWGKGDSL